MDTAPPPRDRGDDGGRRDDGPYRPLRDERQEVERLDSQVKLILDSIEGARVYPPDRPGDVEYLYLEGRILLRDADLARVQEIVPGSNAGERTPELTVNGLTVYELDGIDTLSALERIDTTLGVGVATPEHIFWLTPRGVLCPADEPTPVTGDRPWPETGCEQGAGGGVVVTVVDSGFISDVGARHAWLSGVTGDEESYDANDIGPYVGHGTFVAGVVRSVAPAAEVHVEGILTHGGAVTETAILGGLHHALNRMPDIISMSAGCTTRYNLPPLGFEVFWEHRLRHCKGTVLVVAAGNDGSRRAFWPATFEWTVSVGAVDRGNERAPFSNFGSWVDVYALGVDMVNAYPDGTMTYKEPPRVGGTATFSGGLAAWSGTSFSTPLVAGMIAARMSVTGQSGAQAGGSILGIARQHALPGVGAFAEPATVFLPDPAGP